MRWPTLRSAERGRAGVALRHELDASGVIDQMLAAGLEMPPTPLDLSGRVRRFGKGKTQWYRLRELRTDGGSWVVTGSFGNWKGGERHRVDVDWRGIGDAERAELHARRQAQAEKDAAERAALARLAQASAADLWRAASTTGRSAYLERKGVDAEGCRFLPDGSIVIPLLRYDAPSAREGLRGAQRIHADGAKRFTRGFDKKGASLRLGHVVAGEPLLVCEGYATGLTLRMAAGRRLPVFVALDAGNLLPVCELLRTLYPHAPILLCADDDWRTDGNPGREKAHKACRAIARCHYTWPVFRPHNRGSKDTDYNDLHRVEGLGVVRRQLGLAARMLGSPWPDAA